MKPRIVLTLIALIPLHGCEHSSPSTTDPSRKLVSQDSTARSSDSEVTGQTSASPLSDENLATTADEAAGQSEVNVTATAPPGDDPLAGFPATILNYEFVRQASGDFPDAEEVVRLKATIDLQRYAVLVKQLQELLRSNAKESGAGLLGLADPSEPRSRGIIYYGPTSPEALTGAVNSAVNDNKGCVVIVAKRLTEQPWKETRTGPAARAPGGSRSFQIDWYWVSDQTARPLRNTFRRACEMELHPVVQSRDGKMSLQIIAPFAWTAERMKNNTILMPGGPAGHVFSAGTGGGDLNIASAHDSYIKSLLRSRKWPDTAISDSGDVFLSERVLLFMPCMMIEGKFLESAILPVETSVLAAQVAGDDLITIEPILP